MITFTEKERTWILSDPGEIALGLGGKLEPSITPSMFIESPSSLDLMLGMQKRPSWDCRFPTTSTILENKCVPQNAFDSKTHPHHKRKRKASWRGGFEDQGRPFQSDSTEIGHVQEKSMGYSSPAGRGWDTKIDYQAEEKVLLESPGTEKSVLKIFGPETNEGLWSRNSSSKTDNVCMEKHTSQQNGRTIQEITKVPKFVSSLLNSRLRKRTKKLEDKSHCKDILGQSLQGCKAAQSKAEGLLPSDVKVEDKLAGNCDTTFSSKPPLADQACNGAGFLAIPIPGEHKIKKECPSANQGQDSHHDGTSAVRLKETKDSLSGEPLPKPKRRIKIVGQHGLQDRCAESIVKTKIETQSFEKESDLQRPTHKDQPVSKKSRPKRLSDDNGPTASNLEKKAKGCSKPPKPQGATMPLLSGASSQTENCCRRKSPKESQSASMEGGQRCGTLPPNMENLRNGPPKEGAAEENVDDVDDILTSLDFDQLKAGDARSRTRKLLQLFYAIHKQFKGGHKEVDVRNIIVECYPEYLVNGSESLYGEIPGVEAGDRFNYRVEMDLVGLHHHLRRGIDVILASQSNWCIQGKPVSIAACIVVAGGYVDNRDDGDVIIYTGEGGNNHFYDKGPSKDQTLTFGNKALRHSMMLGLYVRVVRKFDMKPPAKPFYRYDGLYEVMEMKKERSRGHHRKSKGWSLEKDGETKKISKCKAMGFKPLVYKFVLLRKSARDKYKDVNLWNFKPPTSAHVPKSG